MHSLSFHKDFFHIVKLRQKAIFDKEIPNFINKVLPEYGE